MTYVKIRQQTPKMCFVFLKKKRLISSLKGPLERFLFQKYYCETIVKQLWQFLEFFRTNFDSLRPRNRKIIEIIYSLRRRRNAFRTQPNQTEVRRNRYK